jgi:hypothetical protein
VTWRNPWAWLGLATLALPVLVHLFSRREPRVEPFPSLRFVPASPLRPTPRTRLADPWLLALRLVLLALAVAALAQPTPDDAASARRAAASRLARAIVLDTSEAAPRADADLAAAPGRPSAEGADRAAAPPATVAALADSADTHALLRTADPAGALAGAVAWLGTQDARRELVLVSTFRRGTIDSAALAAIPADVGLRFVPREAGADTSPRTLVRTARGDGARLAVEAHADGDRTLATWRRLGRDGIAAADDDPAVMLRTRPADSVSAGIARRAALAMRPVALAAPGRAPLVIAPDTAPAGAARDAVLAPWMGETLIRLARDPLLASGAPERAPSLPTPERRGDTLVLHAPMPADDARLAALAAAALGARDAALGAGADHGALEPAQIAAAQLAAWSRPPSAEVRAPASIADDPLVGPSGARWGWITVLALLGVEALARRWSGAAAR